MADRFGMHQRVVHAVAQEEGIHAIGQEDQVAVERICLAQVKRQVFPCRVVVAHRAGDQRQVGERQQQYLRPDAVGIAVVAIDVQHQPLVFGGEK